MNEMKLWPHVTIIVVLCAVIGGVAGALLFRQGQPTEAQAAPSAARVERVDGEVALNRSLVNDESNKQWTKLTPNTPISMGDRIYTRDNSRISIAFTGRNFARLNDNTSLDVLSLSHGRTQLALREGSAIFNVGRLSPDELFEVATPYGAVDLQQPGLYEVGIDDRGSTIVSVLSGLAQVIGLAGSGQVSKGEMLTLLGQTAADVVLSRLDPSYASGLVDDYYAYQYPRTYDGRYSDYNAYLNDPYYYDPYNRYASYRYVDDTIPGVYDLDYYGDWQDVNGYGYVWQPRVEANWAPYQQGYWVMDDLYGMTWVSNDPWGYAPYHYGRWAYINNQWFWIPDRVNTQPAYAPALVAFVPLTQTNLIGWAPLGPGDPYAVPYYDANLQPVYLTQTPVLQQQMVNLYVPGALTVVPVQDFNSMIDQHKIKKVDKEMLAQVRPVLDPLTIDTLRQVALQNAKARRKADVPEDIARRLDNRRVITSTTPVAPPSRKDKDMARALRTDSVTEKQRKEKFRVKDNRQQGSGQQPVEARQPGADAPSEQTAAAPQERKQKTETLSPETARGNKEDRQQAREIERQQRRERVQQTVTRQPAIVKDGVARAESDRTPQKPRGERVGQKTREQRGTARQEAVGQPQVVHPASQQPRTERGAGEKPQKQQKPQGGGGGPQQSPKGGGKGKGRP